MTKKFQAIPTNLITGFLGSGKTTAILQLLKSRPKNSQWAVLVNEFGDVGIDGALMKQEGVEQGVFIKEVPGGCICCAAGLPLQMALNLLIQQARPQRILIEPTGVGHPKKIMDTLKGEFYKNVLDLRATICLVEAQKLKQEKYRQNETFMDQMNIADILLANKSDQATTNELEFFQAFCQSFAIPKAFTGCIEYGDFPVDILDLDRNTHRRVTHPDAHSKRNNSETHSHGPDSVSSIIDVAAADDNMVCDWRRFENHGQDYFGCGWIFNREIVFAEGKLDAWVRNSHLSRVKGLFRTHNGWLQFNCSEQQLTKESSGYKVDSRVEIIESEAQDWQAIEEQLIDCIECFSGEK